MFIEVFTFDALSKAPLTDVNVEKKIWNSTLNDWSWQKEFNPANATLAIFDSQNNQIYLSEPV